MRPLRWLGLALVIALILAAHEPTLAKGGHGGHGHGGHHSHGHGGHGHHGHAKHGHTHHATAHSGHHHAHNHAFAHHHAVHNVHHPRHHAAWNHHYAHHHHGWGHHYGWDHHHGWGWGGWNWYGGGAVGPSYVDNGYVGPNVNLVNPALPPNGPAGGVGLFSLVGTIRSIKGAAIAVASEDGDPVTIDATPDTKIVLNSRQATLADLQPQDRVKVRYDEAQHAMTLVAVRS
jgi:hypothetical protein